jgi:acyl-CoA oxidase
MATETLPPSDFEPEEPAAPTGGPYPVPQIDVPALRAFLDGEYAEVRDLVRANLAEYASILTDAETMSTADFRERVKDVVVEMAKTGQTGMGFPKEYGGGGDIGASLAAFETLAYGDLSVLVKVGVQFGLFGGAILQLGTKPHHDAYLAKLITGETMGCFAMTETGHGSNVQALGTVATYDADAQEFVIQTTREDAWKDYIGNAAVHAELAVVFAQLEVDGEGRGVHAFVVPIREQRQVCPGVTIEDDGLKMGLNGVDNGRIRFDGVRVPRTALLNRFADVREDGTYVSDIENANRRFFTMLGTLVQGRVCVGGGGLNAAKVALTIAIRYGLRRRQFEATTEGEEDLLLDYGQHQRRLFPLLARTYALDFAQEIVAGQCHAVFSGVLTGEAGDEKVRRARVARRPHQGAGDLARDPDHPGVPGGVRRRGLPLGQPLRGAQGRHRRLHHVRGRQHRPAPAGGQGPAHRLLQRLRGPRPARHGPVRHEPGGRDRHREDQRPQAAGATSGTRRPVSSTPTTSWRCCASARSTPWRASPGASSAAWTTR